MSAHLARDIDVEWTGSTTLDPYPAPSTLIKDASGNTTVDATVASGSATGGSSWLVVAYPGGVQLTFIHESNLATIDTIIDTISGTPGTGWWPLWIIRGTTVLEWHPGMVLPLKEEGDLLFEHSPDDPATTPPEPTRLPIGDVGQLMHVVPDASGYITPYDPNQATNHSKDPAWTVLSLAEGGMLVFKRDSNGVLLVRFLPIGTDGYILTVKPDAGAFDASGATTTANEPSWQSLLYAAGKALLAAGDLLVGVGGGADAVVLGRGADKTVLESSSSGISWSSDHENRIVVLETHRITDETNIANLQSDMAAAQSDIATLQSQMTTANSNISSLNGRVGALEAGEAGE